MPCETTDCTTFLDLVANSDLIGAEIQANCAFHDVYFSKQKYTEIDLITVRFLYVLLMVFKRKSCFEIWV